MKYKLYFPLFILSFTAHATTLHWTERLNPHESITVESTEQQDQLQKIRETVATQTAQIKGILDTVCDALRTSNLPSKDSLCRELSLLRDFVQHLTLEIPTMQEQDLVQLTRVNTLVLEALIDQLQHGNLQGICSIDITKITHMPRITITVDQLQELTNIVQNHLITAWNTVTELTLERVDPSYTEQAWEMFNDNKTTLLVTTAAAIGAAWIARSGANLQNIFQRLLTYDLLALYLLRQKKDKDVRALAEYWLGKNSLATKSILSIKHWVGSPKEKKTAVQVFACHDMTAQEQIDWAERQDCAVVKVDKGREENQMEFLKNFFEFDDGLFKISLGLLFAEQLKQDIKDLAALLADEKTVAAYGVASQVPASVVRYLIEKFHPGIKKA